MPGSTCAVCGAGKMCSGGTCVSNGQGGGSGGHSGGNGGGAGGGSGGSAGAQGGGAGGGSAGGPARAGAAAPAGAWEPPSRGAGGRVDVPDAPRATRGPASAPSPTVALVGGDSGNEAPAMNARCIVVGSATHDGGWQ